MFQTHPGGVGQPAVRAPLYRRTPCAAHHFGTYVPICMYSSSFAEHPYPYCGCGLDSRSIKQMSTQSLYFLQELKNGSNPLGKYRALTRPFVATMPDCSLSLARSRNYHLRLLAQPRHEFPFSGLSSYHKTSPRKRRIFFSH